MKTISKFSALAITIMILLTGCANQDDPTSPEASMAANINQDVADLTNTIIVQIDQEALRPCSQPEVNLNERSAIAALTILEPASASQDDLKGEIATISYQLGEHTLLAGSLWETYEPGQLHLNANGEQYSIQIGFDNFMEIISENCPDEPQQDPNISGSDLPDLEPGLNFLLGSWSQRDDDERISFAFKTGQDGQIIGTQTTKRRDGSTKTSRIEMKSGAGGYMTIQVEGSIQKIHFDLVEHDLDAATFISHEPGMMMKFYNEGQTSMTLQIQNLETDESQTLTFRKN